MNITKAWMETCGTASLEGSLYEAGITNPQLVTLRFERSPITEKGPDLLLIPDFAHVCFARSLVNLCKQGYEFEIEEYTVGKP